MLVELDVTVQIAVLPVSTSLDCYAYLYDDSLGERRDTRHMIRIVNEEGLADKSDAIDPCGG